MIDFIENNFLNIVEYVSYAIAVATVIVKLTPNATDNKYLEMFVKIFEIISGNTTPINSKKD